MRIFDFRTEEGLDEWTRRFLRLCAVHCVQIDWNVEIEPLTVPIVGSSRVAHRRGAETWTLRITQGPARDVVGGGRPLPVEVMGSADARQWRSTPLAAWMGARRSSFGGIELEIMLRNGAAFEKMLHRVYGCLATTGDLSELRLPNPRDLDELMLVFKQFQRGLPWRGYSRIAA